MRSQFARQRGHWIRRAVLIAVGAVAACAAAAQPVGEFTARLAPAPRDTAMRQFIAGHGTAVATLDGDRLTVSGRFAGLRSAATSARLHAGTVPGVRGPALAELELTAGNAGTITGVVAVDAELRRRLTLGVVYLQVDSESAPDGNLWGWFGLRQ